MKYLEVKVGESDGEIYKQPPTLHIASTVANRSPGHAWAAGLQQGLLRRNPPSLATPPWEHHLNSNVHEDYGQPLELCCTCSWKFSSSRVCSSPLLDQRSLLWCHLLSWISGNWNVENVISSFDPEWIPNVRQFVNLPFLCCFASCSHRVLENFKEDVVEMGWYIGGGHSALVKVKIGFGAQILKVTSVTP